MKKFLKSHFVARAFLGMLFILGIGQSWGETKYPEPPPPLSGECKTELAGAAADTSGHAARPEVKNTGTLEPLMWQLHPYERDIPREEHESEKAGELYAPGAKFDPTKNIDGTLRKDGVYVFTIARDADGLNRIADAPRFDMNNPNGKYMNSHRSVLRKFRKELGDDVTPLVFGEVEILGGKIVCYTSKAGTAFDGREADQPEIFNQRKQLAEDSGFDLSHVRPDRIINYAYKDKYSPDSKDKVPGRHAKEEELAKIMEVLHQNKLTRDMAEEYYALARRMYALFPNQDPYNPFDMQSPLLRDLDIPMDVLMEIVSGQTVLQSDTPWVNMEFQLREAGNLTAFARVLDNLNWIVNYAESVKAGKKPINANDWDHVPMIFSQRAAAMANRDTPVGGKIGGHTVSFDNEGIPALKVRLNNALNPPPPPPVATVEKAKSPPWIIGPGLKSYFEVPQNAQALRNAEKLIHIVRGVYSNKGVFDAHRFSLDVTLQNGDAALTEDWRAQQLIQALVEESAKPGGNPAQLYLKMRIAARTAAPDQKYFTPDPDAIIQAFLRTLKLKPAP